jgi:hypothetical protein
MSQEDVTPESNRAAQLVENDGTPDDKSVAQTDNGQQHTIEKDFPMVVIPLTERLANDAVEHDADHIEVPSTVTDVEAVTSSNGEIVNENALDVHKEHPPLSFPAKTVEIVNEDDPIDAGQSIKSGDADVTTKIDQEISQSVSIDLPSNSETQLEDGDIKVEPLVNQKRQQEDKTEKKRQLEDKADGSPLKVQDQLDEVK